MPGTFINDDRVNFVWSFPRSKAYFFKYLVPAYCRTNTTFDKLAETFLIC